MEKSLPPLNDLCLVHKEQHLYYNVPKLSSLSNVHYHANVECPKVRFANFVPSAVLVPDDLKPSIFVSNSVNIKMFRGVLHLMPIAQPIIEDLFYWTIC